VDEGDEMTPSMDLDAMMDGLVMDEGGEESEVEDEEEE
jgi:hypothetical protein